MKVLLLSYEDHSNFAHGMANALRSVGVDCTDVKRKPHPFGYKSESRVVSDTVIKDLIVIHDVVIFMHTFGEHVLFAANKKKKIYVFHTGTAYRLDPENCNKIFNPYVEATFTDQCEFMQLGAKNIHYVAAAINTDEIQCAVQTKDVLEFAHYPSNPNVKGTNEIRAMLNDVFIELGSPSNLAYYIDEKQLPHKLQIERMKGCQVYIELFKPELYGKPYGCFGVTAFEAAALGKIVITNNIHQEVYKAAYGECAFLIANTEDQFKNYVERLSRVSEREIKRLMNGSRDWLVQKHSYQATGERLKKLLNL